LDITYKKAVLTESADVSFSNLFRHENKISGTLRIHKDGNSAAADFVRDADDFSLNIKIDGISTMILDSQFVLLVNQYGCWNFDVEGMQL